MRFVVDPARAEPLHEQIARQVRAAFEAGELRQGERLPPARELADALDVNMHTVLRGYQSLRDLGLVELRRGAGARIRTDARPVGVRLHELVDELRAEGARLGVSRADLARMVAGAEPPRP
ncbi:GntR family transcriptional regulator [Agrococcus jejuensis]|uniref:DNA-binding transcriptional regulator YhcF, GntR family n=1 Tax=Agrococcus jejuensis TaxID=399736 RepID=A0A1G8AZX3_9MICO|nr:GntR family transcriptional regulator [Agrococcus jejuensis]SDH26498.1 DNA-binding transcriptional regulator YhcF, GntR family [Agrococcus jejuensis]